MAPDPALAIRTGPTRYEIPMLEDAEGYTHWQYCMTMVLEDSDLMSIVDGTLPRPNAATHPVDHANWVSRDRKARIEIATTLRKGPLNLILQIKTSKGCWDRLADRYQGKGNRRVAWLMQAFYRTPLTDTEPMEQQLNKLIEASRNLEAIGCGVNDKTLAYIIIMALPLTLSMLQAILYNKDDTTITSEEVIAQILADEERRVNNSGATATAYFAKAGKKGNNSKSRDNNRDRKKCSYCKKRNHEASECRKKKKDEEEKNNAKGNTGTSSASSSAKANIAVAEDDLIRLLDPDSDSASSGIGHALMARVAHDPALLDVFPSNAHPTEDEHALITRQDLNEDDLTQSWLIDSSASRIMCSHRSWFRYFTPLAQPIKIILGDNSSIPATGLGWLVVNMNADDVRKRVVLQDVLYVPEMGGNLLSVSHMARRGAEMRFKGEACKILDRHEDLMCLGQLHGNLYIMDMEVELEEHAKIAIVPFFPAEGDDVPDAALAAYTRSSNADLTTWHRRLGHLNADAVNLMISKGMVSGMKITRGSTLITPCEPCIKGKQTRTEIHKFTETRADTVLGRIFSDVCGRMVKSYEGYEYFVTWVDDKSRKVFVDGLRAKSDVFEHLKTFIARAEVETGCKVVALRSDGGGEYTAHSVQEYLREKGIKHEMTTPNTPQHNGVAERMNRTLLDKVRTMLIDADLPEVYWFDALRYATYIHNVATHYC